MPGFIIEGQDASEGPGISNVSEVRRRHRWKFTTTGESADISAFALSVDRPKVTIASVEIHHMQDVIYIPAKNKWDPINIVFYEMETPNLTTAIMKWINKVVDFKQSALTNYKQKSIITLLDGCGKDKWVIELLNSWPSEINPDDLNYSDSALLRITVKMYYDKAREHEAGA